MSEIISIEPVVLGLPMAQPVHTSFGTMAHRYSILVRIETRAGLWGWGESWSNFPAWSPYERVRTIADGVAPLLMGQDATEVEHLHERMTSGLRRLALQCGAPGPISQAISAVDIALWDLRGKECGEPIWRLLGRGDAPLASAVGGVPVYASGLGPGDPTEMFTPLANCGVTAAKLKVGFGWETDIRNLTVPADNMGALAELRRQAGCWIVGGENVYGRTEFRRLIEAAAVDLVQPDICKTGGLTEAIAICQLAWASGLPYAPHYLGGAIGFVASLHLCAAMPGLWAMELDANPNPLRTELGGDLLEVHDGRIRVPTGPGLGMDIDHHMLSRFRLPIR